VRRAAGQDGADLLQGYSEERSCILPPLPYSRQIKENGITAEQIEFPEDAVRWVVRHYTREAACANSSRYSYRMPQAARRVVEAARKSWS